MSQLDARDLTSHVMKLRLHPAICSQSGREWSNTLRVPLCGSVSRSTSASNYCCSEPVDFQAVSFSQGQMIHQPKQRGLTFNPNSSLPTLLSHCLNSVSQWNTMLSIRRVFCSLSGWWPHPGAATTMDYDCHAHLGIRSSASDFSNRVETEPRSVRSAWGGLLK